MKLINKFRLWKYNLVKRLLEKFGTVSIQKQIGNDKKTEFELDLLELIKKYDVIGSKHKIQRIEVIVDVLKVPEVNVKTYIF